MRVFKYLFFLIPCLVKAEYTSQASVSFWALGSHRKLLNPDSNPENRIYKLPSNLGSLEARPNFKLSSEKLSFRGRARFVGTISQTKLGSTYEKAQTSGEKYWNEAMLSYSIADTILTYGLQNYQWGPAESASPSNRIYHETISKKDLAYDPEGKHIAKLSYTPKENLSIMGLIELSANEEESFRYNQDFSKTYVLKSEYSWNGSADYVDLIAGKKENEGYWFGTYFNLDLMEGWSFYTDSAFEEKSFAFYPKKDSTTGLITLEQGKKDRQHLYNFSVGGLRYNFVNGNDVRLEYIYQEAGYSKNEMDLTYQALSSNLLFQKLLLPDTIKKANRTGLDFPGKHYGLISLRSPDSFKKKDWTLYLRSLASLTDWSTSNYISSEYPVGDQGTFLTSFNFTSGKDNSELRGLMKYVVNAGYKHTF